MMKTLIFGYVKMQQAGDLDRERLLNKHTCSELIQLDGMLWTIRIGYLMVSLINR